MQFLSALEDLLEVLVLVASAGRSRRRRSRPDAASSVTLQSGAVMRPPPPTAAVGLPRRDGGVAGWTAPPPADTAPPPADAGRAASATGCSTALALGLGVVGPLFALFTTMGGGEAVVSITVGTCGTAGILFAVGLRGARGAIAVLVIPLGWAVLASLMLISMWNGGYIEPGEGLEVASPGVLFVLAVTISTEAGYLGGRLVARLGEPR